MTQQNTVSHFLHSVGMMDVFASKMSAYSDLSLWLLAGEPSNSVAGQALGLYEGQEEGMIHSGALGDHLAEDVDMAARK